jgi:hypothetical protein
MMEYFTPQGKRKPYPACMDEVDLCDVVIVIVAHQYGWVPEDQPGGEAKSITWLECERAKEVIAFIVDEEHEWPTDKTEAYRLTEAISKNAFYAELPNEVLRNITKLQEFKTWLSRKGFYGKFRTPADLKTDVLRSLLRNASARDDPSKYLAAP